MAIYRVLLGLWVSLLDGNTVYDKTCIIYEWLSVHVWLYSGYISILWIYCQVPDNKKTRASDGSVAVSIGSYSRRLNAQGCGNSGRVNTPGSVSRS